MGFIDDITSLLLRRRESTAPAPSPPAPSPARTGLSYADLLASSSPALCIATAYRCVKLLSESVAQLDFRYMRLKDGIFVQDRNSRLSYLLSVEPNPAHNSFDFKRQMVVDVLTKGNAYVVPAYEATDGGVEISRLVLTDKVQHDTVNDRYSVSDLEQGLQGEYGEGDLIHIKGLSRGNPKTGVSVLSYARMALDTAYAGDAETKKRFSTGGIVRGIVSNDKSVRGFGEYADKELAKTAYNLDERFNVNGENIVALPGMVSYNGLSMTSADMQFLESRKFTVREICRFFGVHPSFVFDDTSNNYKSAEMANAAFLSNTLNPMLRQIEVEFLRKLVSPTLALKRSFSFDRQGLTSSDLDTRVKYQTQTIAAGLLTVNEWRRIENRPPVEGGDKALVSANLRGIDEPASSGSGAANGDNSNNNKQDKSDEE